MTCTTFIALMGFAFVASITPGPNNVMLMASGANFGLRRTVPHILGVCLGFVFMIILVGLGVAQIFDVFPALFQVLKWVSVAYLLYLAWRIATASAPAKGQDGGTAVPLTFLQAAGFQWVNPKAWVASLSAQTVYAPHHDLISVFLVGLAFLLVNMPSVSVWVVLGRELRRVLSNPTRLKLFNWTMAGLLVVSLYPVLRDV
jgi:threonine/homoserine/homoserine lactone efflux protein